MRFADVAVALAFGGVVAAVCAFLAGDSKKAAAKCGLLSSCLMMTWAVSTGIHDGVTDHGAGSVALDAVCWTIATAGFAAMALRQWRQWRALAGPVPQDEAGDSDG